MQTAMRCYHANVTICSSFVMFYFGCLQKAAIKKMDMQATNEFLAELKVLTHVHHLNLVSDSSFLLLLLLFAEVACYILDFFLLGFLYVFI
jgi:hypothetical protein